MKFTSSFSSSSSSFDANSSSNKSATAGCIAGVFRRLLCFNSLPTYPSEFESSSGEFDVKQVPVNNISEGKVPGTPNLVARLMGLESLPRIDLLDDQNGSGCSAISRSRSMNYVDTVMKELQGKKKKHRRVQSFRENPTFLDLEDENFLILSFENGAESMEFTSKLNKSSSSSLPAASDKTKNNKNREQSSSSGFEKIKENQDTRKRVKKIVRESAAAAADDDDHSENSSPNSVLDKISDFSCDQEHENNISEENSISISRLRNCRTRRTLLTEELENYRKLLNPQNSCGLKSKTANGIRKSVQIKRKGVGNDQRYAEIRRMAEKETMESNWVRVRSCSNSGEEEEEEEEEGINYVNTDLELKIMDQLLTELLLDLNQLHTFKFFFTF